MLGKQIKLKTITRKSVVFSLIIVLLIITQSLFAVENNSDRIIYFYPNTDIIKESSYSTLENIVLSLKNDIGLEIRLDGYTNSIGVAQAELELSKKRALKVASYLIEKGVNKERISTDGFGGNKLIVEGVDAINRRVEVNIVKSAIQTTAAKVEVKNVESGSRRITIEISDVDNKALVANLEVKKKINNNLELLKNEVVNKSIMLDIPVNTKIELLVTADTYMPQKVNLDLNEDYKKIILEKIEIGKSYSIDNIYFDSMKSSIKRESFDIINKIINVLRDNKNMKVKVIGHTQSPNQRLSDDRASAVVKYFTRRSISEDRLIFEGNSNKALFESKEGKRIKNNMRVEFIFFE